MKSTESLRISITNHDRISGKCRINCRSPAQRPAGLECGGGRGLARIHLRPTEGRSAAARARRPYHVRDEGFLLLPFILMKIFHSLTKSCFSNNLQRACHLVRGVLRRRRMVGLVRLLGVLGVLWYRKTGMVAFWSLMPCPYTINLNYDSIGYLNRSNSRRRRAPARTRRRRWVAPRVGAGRGAPGPAAAEAPGAAWCNVRWTAGGRSGRGSRSARRAAGSALGAGVKHSQLTANQLHFRI